jgi:hypothetical protein
MPDSTFAVVSKLSSKTFDHIGNRIARIERTITRTTTLYLQRMAKQEGVLQKALLARDSGLAAKLYPQGQDPYRQLLANVASVPTLREYLPVIDSLHAALSFIGHSNLGMAQPPGSTLAAVQKAEVQLRQLESAWQRARDAESFIRQREQHWSSQLASYSTAILPINRSAFYFQQQLVEYKALLQDRDKVQERVLNAVRGSTAFQHFIQTNSYVGKLFGLPANYGSPASLHCLQTKDMIQQRLGLNAGQAANAGEDPGHYLQQKVESGQQQLSQLKTKLRSLGHFSGGGEVVMSRFTPNGEKINPFGKRLEYGFSLQTLQRYGIMPATVDLGITLGYKLSPNATVGVGGSYILGLGQGFPRLSYSGQGAGVRSFIDVKAKGGLWLSGGLEYNYVHGFSTWQGLSHWDEWQKSALFGLSKKFRLSAGRSSSLQLLFDALYKQHVPASPPVIFRAGYNFN